MKSQTPGIGQAYLGAYTDSNGDWLRGETGLLHDRVMRECDRLLCPWVARSVWILPHVQQALPLWMQRRPALSGGVNVSWPLRDGSNWPSS